MGLDLSSTKYKFYNSLCFISRLEGWIGQKILFSFNCIFTAFISTYQFCHIFYKTYAMKYLSYDIKHQVTTELDQSKSVSRHQFLHLWRKISLISNMKCMVQDSLVILLDHDQLLRVVDINNTDRGGFKLVESGSELKCLKCLFTYRGAHWDLMWHFTL